MRCIRIVTAAAALIATVTVALAHAHLDHASPAAGSTVKAAPTQVSIWFTQQLEPAFSTVEVSDAAGKRVDRGKPQVADKVIRIDLQALPPGHYTVNWRAVSVDTHTTSGSFLFDVKP
jgi:methionine-rich copper-binding protein CopC